MTPVRSVSGLALGLLMPVPARRAFPSTAEAEPALDAVIVGFRFAAPNLVWLTAVQGTRGRYQRSLDAKAVHPVPAGSSGTPSVSSRRERNSRR